jgi:hypothetical protein
MNRFEITAMTRTNVQVFFVDAEDPWLAYWQAAEFLNYVEPNEVDIAIIVREASKA